MTGTKAEVHEVSENSEDIERQISENRQESKTTEPHARLRTMSVPMFNSQHSGGQDATAVAT